MRSIIVTAADAAYFNMVADWLDLIRSFPELAELETCILDIGLTDGQRDRLSRYKTRLVQPDWDIDSVEQHPERPAFFKAMTVRPFLPKYFPDHEIIGWFDADVWVQEASFLQLYLRAAERHGFAIAAEIDRSYSFPHGEPYIRPAYPFSYGCYNGFRLLHYTAYERCFGRDTAKRLIKSPVVNSGAFAVRRDHPIWAQWGEACRRAIGNAPLKHAEQAALNLAIYNAPPAHRPHMLPPRANWICALSLPSWDPVRQMLVEPYMPHEPIGIVHLTSVVNPIDIASTDDGVVTATLTFSGIRALRADNR